MDGNIKVVRKTNRREMMNMTKFINVYDVFEAFGGHEEGGWYYTANTLEYSVEVPEELVEEKMELLKNYMESNDLDDLVIRVEDEEGQSVTTKPEWS